MYRSAHLEVVAGLVEQHIPIYEAGQWDPVEAARTGRGSCFSKNVFGAIILEVVADLNTATAISWGEKQHPKPPTGFMLDLTRKRAGHSSLLVGTAGQPHHVRQLSFNERYRRSDEWHIYELNDPDDTPNAVYANKTIVATDAGRLAGLHIHPWYEAGRAYTEALGRDDTVFHRMTQETIREIVLDTVKVDALPRQIPKTRPA